MNNPTTEQFRFMLMTYVTQSDRAQAAELYPHAQPSELRGFFIDDDARDECLSNLTSKTNAQRAAFLEGVGFERYAKKAKP